MLEVLFVLNYLKYNLFMPNKYKVLIIEDDLVMLRLYERLFVSENFTVVTAPDGEQGLVQAAETLPDIILLDIMMPKMDGLKVLESIKKEPKTSQIPVIVLSNLATDAIVTDALRLGAVSYLKKSEVSNEAILKEVNTIIKK
jgi:CheY-like chemotaxis protein